MKVTKVLERTSTPTMAISLERLDVVDERDESFCPLDGTRRDSSNFADTNLVMRSPLPDFASLVSGRLKSAENPVQVSSATMASTPRKLSKVKGAIFKDREVRENTLLKSLIKIGQLDQAREKIVWMGKQKMTVVPEVRELLENSTGQHDWRSPWTPFKRLIPRWDTRTELLKELHQGSAKMEQVKADEQRKSVFLGQWQADREKLQKQMKDFTMWQIYLIVPWKDAKVVLDVDSDFTLWRVKKMIHESEGVSVEQQKLWLIRNNPNKARKANSPVSEHATAARNAALRTSALGLLREMTLIHSGQPVRGRAKFKSAARTPPHTAALTATSIKQFSSTNDTQSSRWQPPASPRFHSRNINSSVAGSALGSPRAVSPLVTSQNASSPHSSSPLALGLASIRAPPRDPFASATLGSRPPLGTTRAASPLGMRARSPRTTRWDQMEERGGAKQWASLTSGHGGMSPTRALKGPKRQISLRRVASNPIDYRQLASQKVVIEGDGRLLTSFGIKAGDVLQVGIDEQATKLKQRQAILKELGELNSDDFEHKIVNAFHRFDIDNSGTIEIRELGLSMSSLGIFLTDHELNALARQFDEDDNGHFDLPEFHDMILKILEGGLDDFGTTKW